MEYSFTRVHLLVPYLSILLVLTIIFPQQIHAETRHIHVLKILDSRNQDYIIREACNAISTAIDKEVRLMQDYLDVLTVHTYEITGSNFSREELLKKVDYELSYLESDIVLVVYVGHGFRAVNMKSDAPMLYLNSYEESVNFLDVQQIILEKRPSLLLSMVLACNRTQVDYNRPPEIVAINEPDMGTPLQFLFPRSANLKYQELFKETPNQTKCIDLFGADKEYYTFISQNGGIFFNEALMVFHEAFSENNYNSWEEICQAIEQRTVLKFRQRGINSQKPLCSYYLSFHPFEVGSGAQHTLDKHYFREQKKALKKRQKQQLRNLRKRHRAAMKKARQDNSPRRERRVIAFQNRAELKELKARHQIDLLRLEKRMAQEGY